MATLKNNKLDKNSDKNSANINTSNVRRVTRYTNRLEMTKESRIYHKSITAGHWGKKIHSFLLRDKNVRVP
jgi:hypothetical protein